MILIKTNNLCLKVGRHTNECLIVIVMISNPTPISFAWLIIPNNRIVGYIYPRNAELDIFIMVVIASPLPCSLVVTTWSGQLCQHFQIDILCQQINEVMWGHWILQKKAKKCLVFHAYMLNQLVYGNLELRNWSKLRNWAKLRNCNKLEQVCMNPTF
jgi:hypothetical protein